MEGRGGSRRSGGGGGVRERVQEQSDMGELRREAARVERG